MAGRRRPHAKLVARNRAVLASLQPTCSTRAFRTVPPQELTDAAHKAARLTDTDAHIQTASRAYTRPFWYQSRVWDPLLYACSCYRSYIQRAVVVACRE